jgi:hypothetical protein
MYECALPQRTVDTRAFQEIEDLTEQLGDERIVARCGNSLSSQSIGPKTCPSSSRCEICWISGHHCCWASNSAHPVEGEDIVWVWRGSRA